MEDIKELQPLLDKPQRIVITTHQKPDGDALGSSLALCNYLIQRDHVVSVITPTDYPGFLNWMAGNDKVIIYSDDSEQCDNLIRTADIIFCLDFNSLNRIGEMEKPIKESKAIRVLIDHHLEPHDFDDYRLWDSKASSTCELIYDFIILCNGSDLINKDLAECLYAGLMTDTGSFKFPATTSKVHRIVADLMDKGTEITRIHNLIDNSFSISRLKFFGYCLSRKMTIIKEINAAYMAITAEEVRKYYLGTGDTEGLVNYPLSIKDITCSVLMIDRTPPNADKKIIKMSFRSQEDIAVNGIARDHFNGGGHKNAAGGLMHITIEETVDKLLKVLPDYLSINKLATP